MRYQLYIYNTTAVSPSAYAIDAVNNALHTPSLWEREDITKYMKAFDVTDVKEQINVNLGGKCSVQILYPPPKYEQIGSCI